MRHARNVHLAEFNPSGGKILTTSADRTAQWAPHGSSVVTTTRNGVVQIWNSETGQAVGSPLSDPAGIYLTEFTPDGQQILTANRDGFIRLWDTASGKLKDRKSVV